MTTGADKAAAVKAAKIRAAILFMRLNLSFWLDIQLDISKPRAKMNNLIISACYE
jgi:hypothetical protein